MNILIVGGLFAIAILAIIGIILLFLSERGAEAARKANMQPPPPTKIQSTAPTIAQSARPTIPLTPQEHSEPMARLAAKEPLIQRRTFPRKGETTGANHEDNSLLPMLNGQFHEFVDELRDLHQQAWELEHRLSTLTQMVDRIERSQDHHVSIEEDNEETFNVEDAQE